MEHELAVYAAGYVGLRIALAGGLAYAIYGVLRRRRRTRPGPALAAEAVLRAERVVDDRC